MKRIQNSASTQSQNRLFIQISCFCHEIIINKGINHSKTINMIVKPSANSEITTAACNDNHQFDYEKHVDEDHLESSYSTDDQDAVDDDNDSDSARLRQTHFLIQAATSVIRLLCATHPRGICFSFSEFIRLLAKGSR